MVYVKKLGLKPLKIKKIEYTKKPKNHFNKTDGYMFYIAEAKFLDYWLDNFVFYGSLSNHEHI